MMMMMMITSDQIFPICFLSYTV
jgi:hypothetical protein